MQLDECIEKGLIRTGIPDDGKSKKSLEVAQRKLARAKQLFSLGLYEEVAASAYSVMFHAARSLLFRDGFTEKSHYALFVFLKEKYHGLIEPRFISEFNSLRFERHAINYGLEETEIKKDEALQVSKVAEDFLSAVKKIIL